MERLYFAYGSNLHPLRLAERTPSCEVVGRAELPAHTLRFHKWSVDRSTKCDAFRTGIAADRVLGALFRIAPQDKPALDRAEGLGYGYDEHAVSVRTSNGTVDAFTYLAADEHIRDGQPFRWYKDYVVLGAIYHDLPTDYRARIESQPAIDDPDLQRSRAHERVLRSIRRQLGEDGGS